MMGHNESEGKYRRAVKECWEDIYIDETAYAVLRDADVSRQNPNGDNTWQGQTHFRQGGDIHRVLAEFGYRHFGVRGVSFVVRFQLDVLGSHSAQSSAD